MLDRDLALLYGVETKRLNEVVKRNKKRFPEDFCFQLNLNDYKMVTNLKSQFATSNWGGRRKPIHAFTEHGIAMLSGVLNSERAIEVNIAIIREFIKLRRMMISYEELSRKLHNMENKYDGSFKVVFEAIKGLMSEREIPRKKIVGLLREKKK